MTETKEKKGGDKKPLSLSKPGKLSIKKRVERTQVEQKFPHGRRKAVEVEVVKKRTYQRDEGGKMRRISEEAPVQERTPEVQEDVQAPPRQLTEREREARARALKSVGQDSEAERVQHDVKEARRLEREEQKRQEEEDQQRRRREEEEADRRREEEERRRSEEARHKADAARLAAKAEAHQSLADPAAAPSESDGDRDAKKRRGDIKKPAPSRRTEPRRREGKLTITQALSGDEGRRQRSDAAFRRKQERERKRLAGEDQPAQKIVREVVIPETITVQELANRMAERGAEVIKSLMKSGIMATITEVIDGDTAELIVAEFGHTPKRVSESDVEIGLDGASDPDEKLEPRAPVVTIMGHVDHGKTSLLDALRATDVAAREAGGITQHIGAYKVTLESGAQITFLDTPGHEAFSEMRSRGAKVTDIVVLVVAADDGIQPQTVEAIAHAKAAEVPIIVAINKIDKAGADANRVRQELLQHELVVEEMGGEILDIEVSATEKINLDKLEEAILLQAELLELKANPDRAAQGAVVEAKLEQGRGSVATVLVQRGTLKVGDIFVAGPEWGRVRALLDDHGEPIESAGPATPVEVLGLQGTPSAGDDFVTVDNETRAREISDYRQRVLKNTNQALGARSTVEQMFTAIEEGETQDLSVVVKADVQGSVEAILSSLQKLVADNQELGVRVLHAGVGGINESDVTLAKASNGLVIGFNVRANPQAREAARRDHVDIRYYSVIYDIVDDAKALLSGMLSPVARENMLGTAEIREVFRVSKVGSVAGCMVTNGIVKRGARVRLLRDDVVIHEGGLSTLKRFKDDVREVKEGFECGLSLENYQNIKQGDVIECFEVEEVARAL